MDRVLELSLSDEQVAEMPRAFKWPMGSICPHYGSKNIKKNSRIDKMPGIQRYPCKDCGKSPSDITSTIFKTYGSERVPVFILKERGVPCFLRHPRG